MLANHKYVGCPFLFVVKCTQTAEVDEFCWRISRVEGLQHGPCSLLSGACHKLDPIIVVIVPKRPVSQPVELAINKYASQGRLKMKQVMGLLAAEFPDLVTSEHQIKNVMRKFQRGAPELSCRALLERLLVEQRADPDFYVE